MEPSFNAVDRKLRAAERAGRPLLDVMLYRKAYSADNWTQENFLRGFNIRFREVPSARGHCNGAARREKDLEG
jgi:hypothetical protein